MPLWSYPTTSECLSLPPSVFWTCVTMSLTPTPWSVYPSPPCICPLPGLSRVRSHPSPSPLLSLCRTTDDSHRHGDTHPGHLSPVDCCGCVSPGTTGPPGSRCVYILPKPIACACPLGCVRLSLRPGYKAGLLVAGSGLSAHNRRVQARGGGAHG